MVELLEKLFKLIDTYGLVSFLILLVSYIAIRSISGVLKSLNQSATLVEILKELKTIDKKISMLHSKDEIIQKDIQYLKEGLNENKSDLESIRKVVDILYDEYQKQLILKSVDKKKRKK